MREKVDIRESTLKGGNPEGSAANGCIIIVIDTDKGCGPCLIIFFFYLYLSFLGRETGDGYKTSNPLKTRAVSQNF